MADVTAYPGAMKGFTRRSPHEEMELRVQMLSGRHLAAVHQSVIDELGDERAKTIGRPDMSRNPLRSYVGRLARAYLTPPLVQGLSPALAGLIGDMTATTTQARYAKAGGRPMPMRVATVAEHVQRFRIGCNYAGTLVGWADGSRKPYAELITPDDLDVFYASDDPLAPTVIHHRRRRKIGGKDTAVVDVYDLSDLDAPTFRVMEGKDDRTDEVMAGVDGWDGNWLALWRYADGRPWHRIVISGDPREPYRGVELVEGTLRVSAGYTHFWAGVRDAGFPARNAIGLHLDGTGSDSDQQATGTPAGPEYVNRWVHDNPEHPGSLHQFGPGFDPKVVGEAIRAYELGLVEMMGLPVNFERTGGEPTATEAAALAEAIAATYPDCRGHDALVLRRMAAISNRATELLADATPWAFPETAPAILYREEVTEALEAVEPPEAKKKPDDPAKT